MRFPDFLIIGAMKSGTTGLFFDLCTHPQIYLPSEKEPHALCKDAVLTAEGKQNYAAHYRGAPREQLVGDASTGYSKRPDHEGVAQRAVDILPKNFRVIYIVRDPVERIISHHFHDFSRGIAGIDVNSAIPLNPAFVNYSRYAYQLEPWIEAVGWERIHVVVFEEYKSRRHEVVAEVCEFLGLNKDRFPAIDETEIFNKGDGKPVLNGFWAGVRQSVAYRSVVKPMISSRSRHLLRKWFMPRAPERPPPPTSATCEWLVNQLADDTARLGKMLNRPLPWSTNREIHTRQVQGHAS